ncbi:ABC transporter ATP-binding protein [Paenibacillus motobuensis]|uniref:ABC transporter ATP-binding protein n=1 Tax=Paenibacillus TaxID=44249 RepID=UPI002041ED20|nr:ABC transporter ATP-binding protein [Paenibacillus lutimineralis]MCM3649468.1 ABC transporter ATP-binding protein [Paenibacillus motobuensis]
MTNIIMEVKQITKNISKRPIIHESSFQLEQGKIYGFIGPNGAGKTTVMRIMTGLIQPTSGEVRIDWYSVKTQRQQAIARVGAIIESPVFLEYMTGRQVLRNLSRLHPTIKSNQREEHIEKLLTTVGLEKRGDDKVRTYSLGMKQRLGIAQSMLGSPKLLLLDEPSNGLDPIGMRELRDIIFKLRESENLAFFISSHLLDELQQMCDELIIIREGSIILKGPKEDIVKDGQRLEDAFLELVQ